MFSAIYTKNSSHSVYAMENINLYPSLFYEQQRKGQKNNTRLPA